MRRNSGESPDRTSSITKRRNALAAAQLTRIKTELKSSEDKVKELDQELRTKENTIENLMLKVTSSTTTPDPEVWLLSSWPAWCEYNEIIP